MSLLVGKRYRTSMAAYAADHTYVECCSGQIGWGCHGGKMNGQSIIKGHGSSKWANSIAGKNEDAGIRYLKDGICHQMANRILSPAKKIILNARGYKLSSYLYGAFGLSKFDPYLFTPQQGDLGQCNCDSTITEHQARSNERLFIKYLEASSQSPANEVRLLLNLNSSHDLSFGKIENFIEIKEDIDGFLRTEAYPSDMGGLIDFAVKVDKMSQKLQMDSSKIFNEEEYQNIFDEEKGNLISLISPEALNVKYGENAFEEFLAKKERKPRPRF